MKAFLALGVVAFVAVVVHGEMCSDSSNCSITQCASGASLVCIGGTCTCTSLCSAEPNLARCRSQTNCRNAYNNGQITCTCQPLSDLHCIDGECHCGYPTGN